MITLYTNGEEISISAIHVVKDGVELIITSIYRNDQLLWQSVSSCFGAGYWRNDKPWKNDESWKNG